MFMKVIQRRALSLFAFALIGGAAIPVWAEEKNTGKCGPIYNADIARKLVAALERKGYRANYQTTIYGQYGNWPLRHSYVHYWPSANPGNFEFHVLGPFDLTTATKARDDMRKAGFEAERDRMGMNDEWKVYYWK